MRRPISEPTLFWLIAGVAAVVQLATLSAAPDMIGDDYAAYIHNAQALFSAEPYPLPGYVVNPLVDAGPAAYPPGLPLLLHWPVGLFGVNFTVLCAVNALCIGVFVRLFAAWLRPAMPVWAAAAAALLVGVCPFFLAFHNVVASEFLFIALLFGGFLVQRRIEAGTTRFGGAVLAGLLLGGALLTRLAGLPALLGGLVGDVLRRRRLTLAGLLTSVLAGGMLAGGLALVTPELIEHYQANVSADMTASGGLGSVLLSNLISLPGRLSVVWCYGGQGPQPEVPVVLDLLRKAMTVVLLLAGVAGLVRRLRRGAGAAEGFFLLTLFGLLVMPPIMVGPRLMLPLSLLLVGYALEAADLLPGRAAAMRGAVLGALLLGSAVSWAGMAGAPQTQLEANEPRAQALYAWLRDVPYPGETVLARRARAIAFFTGRTAEDWHQTKADADFLRWAAARRASLLVVSVDQADARPAGLDAWLTDFLGENRKDFELAFSNTRFRVYRIPQP